MKQSTKIWIEITGILLVALGIVCICRPSATLFTAAWLIGLFTLVAGISELIFTFRTQAFLPNSGTRMLSGILNVIIGLIFLGNSMFVGLSLPVVFCFWVIIEGIMVAVRSFDYKHAGFRLWWLMFGLGVIAIVLGFSGLRNPVAARRTLSTLIGIAIILTGSAYLVGLSGVSKLEKKFKGVRDTFNNEVDEQ